MRGHYAVGFRRVGNREEGGEGSAWMARVGAPARQFCHASIEEGMNHEKHEIHERHEMTEGTKWRKEYEPRMDTNGHQWIRRGGGSI